jgi:hypothetical protein
MQNKIDRNCNCGLPVSFKELDYKGVIGEINFAIGLTYMLNLYNCTCGSTISEKVTYEELMEFENPVFK